MTSPCNVFRFGEMVWSKQGNAWRLGVILDIRPKDPQARENDDGNYVFTVAPLSHAVLGQEIMLKEASDLRPFLTFSVPSTQLVELEDKSFPDVDWDYFVAHYSQDPDPSKSFQKKQFAGLEASKLAAKCVNNSYSTFNPIGEAQAPDGTVEAKFGGLFLGAEMIQLGDPVRVSAGDGTGVMRLSEIVVVHYPDGTLALQLRGSVFRLVRIQHNPQQPFESTLPSLGQHSSTRSSRGTRSRRSLASSGTGCSWSRMANASRVVHVAAFM